ncbi:glyoxalase [Lentzea sp. NBRC 105346]|uniref:VOC family protein n=1 Tax=Lentzea sp. NBRC 105346 TaxID=3032205 RepID=UPI0024A16E34|nr:VOC family protein [Lentzea sp. NBRC 105346]GLZ29463.1 glyoxalase [Lentzea sp. NBRC 105346]
MPRPVHFEIHAADPERARRFYESVFGWKFEQWGEMPYWMVMTGEEGPGVNGGLLPRQGSDPAPDGPVNGWVMTTGVDDIAVTDKAIAAAGGTVALPIQDMQGVGKVGYYKDTEGNIFGVIEPPAEMR